MKAIIAVYADWGIGNNSPESTHTPAYFHPHQEHIRALTNTHPIVLGQNTWNSIRDHQFKTAHERQLFEQKVILLSDTNVADASPNVEMTHSFLDTLSRISVLDLNSDPVYICGGESVFKQFLPYCDTIYVTYIHARPVCNQFIDNLDEHPGFECIAKSPVQFLDTVRYEFRVYRRVGLKNDFTIIFRSDDWATEYTMRLHTTEPKTNDDIQTLLKTYRNNTDSKTLAITPVEIMDDITDKHPGWEWADIEYGAIIVE